MLLSIKICQTFLSKQNFRKIDVPNTEAVSCTDVGFLRVRLNRIRRSEPSRARNQDETLVEVRSACDVQIDRRDRV